MISGGLSDSATSASQEGARRPVTQAQRPFIAAHLRHPDVAINNMALLVRFADGVEVEALSAAFDRVVADHDVLRTQIDDRLVLEGWVTISPVPPAASSVVAVSIDHCFRWAQHRAEQQLDLAHCCYDSVILDHGDAGASWYLNLHHVITDATGSANVLELTASHYATLVTGISSDRRAASMSPPEPTTAAPRLPEGDKRGAEPSQANPLAAPRRIDGAELYRRAPTPTTEIIATEVALDAGRGQACRDAIALGTYRLLTPNLGWTALLASATAILIHRLTRRPTVRLILPVHRRDRTNVNEPGLAMQMMLLEVEPHADDTHQSLHARVTRTLFDKLRSDHTDWVVGDADAMVNVVPDRAPTRFGGHAVETHWIYSHHEAPELALRLHLTGYGLNEGAAEPLRIQLDVNRGGADDEQLRRCPDHLGSILDAMIAAPDAPIGTAELCLGDERARLVPWESTPTSEQEPFASVVDQLRAALSDRDDIAVESAATRESWTGRDYWRWVEAFAQRLVADGGGPGTRIAIELPMSVEALVAIHAALVVGASFVPIDPEAPDLRRADLTQRSAPAFVVSDRSEVRAARSSDAAGTRGLATSGLAIRDPAPADEAYVMFTSGSTGTPKGVPISHGGLAWHLGWAIEHHLRGRGPIVAPLFGALGFDLTITSLFAPLLADGRLVVFEGAGRTAILDIAARTDLSWCKATPSHMELFAREASADHKLRTLVTNGEAFPPELVQRLHTLLPALEMINEYGPTEAVVGCAFRRIVPESDATSTSVSFGPPAPGTTFRVVDAFDRRTPLGVAGELLISHPHIMTGYLINPDEPVADPFVELDGIRFYRSGDLVRLDERHGYVHLARIDAQLKVGGIRIEPAEIEHAIAAHPAVQRAVVGMIDSATGAATLTAWYELVDGTAIASSEMHAFVAATLPPAMVPAAFVPMGAIPMTENGKLDRRALPRPGREHLLAGPSLAQASTSTERHVVGIWTELLDVSPIGLDDDFFALGGSSLAALRMLSQLEDVLGIVIDVDLAFSHSTPRSLAAAVEAQLDSDTAAQRGQRPPPTLPTTTDAPQITIPERSILFEQRVRADAVMYNVCRTFDVDSDIDAASFAAAIAEAADRHEPLRYTYASNRRLRSSLVETVTGSGGDIDTWLSELHRRPFDLESDPLIRVGIFKHDAHTTLALVVHHVCIDGAGLERLFSDAAVLLEGHDLEPLETSYAAFADWQRGDDTAARQFWLAHEVGDTPRPFGTEDHNEPDGFVRRQSAITADELRLLPATPIALAAASAAAAVAFQSDPTTTSVVDLAVIASTRTHERATPLIGYLVNLLPTTIRIDADDTMGTLLERAGGSIGRALPHRGMPLAEILRHRRQAQRELPPTDVLVAFVDLPDLELTGNSVRQGVRWNGDAVADLTFFLEVHGGEQVHAALEYSGARLGASMAATLLDRFVFAIEQAVHNTDAPVVFDAAAPDTAEASPSDEATPSTTGPSRTRSDQQRGLLESIGRSANRIAHRLRTKVDPDVSGPGAES